MKFWSKSALLSICISVLCLGLFGSSASAALQYINTANATLIVDDNGMLRGAENVLVTDSNDDLLGYYNVSFADASANSLFGTGYSGPYNFGVLSSGPLPANQMSYWMSKALLDNVLINVDDDHKFDSLAYLTYGLGVDVASPENDADFRTFAGSIYTAYGYTDNMIDVTYVTNYYYISSDTMKTNADISPSFNFADSSAGVYAVWTKSSSVPVPGTLLILGSGLLGLAGMSRRRNAE